MGYQSCHYSPAEGKEPEPGGFHQGLGWRLETALVVTAEWRVPLATEGGHRPLRLPCLNKGLSSWDIYE